MNYALDDSGKKVHISNATRENNYFCPSCNEKLVLRKGTIRSHHFAHPKAHSCTDSWHYDMSEWHTAWQNRFPEEYREVVKELNGKRHRADILIEETKQVIEFQHSKLKSQEFIDRNTFYNTLGYKVSWVFDLAKEYDEFPIDKSNLNIAPVFFDELNSKHFSEVKLFFQIREDASDNKKLQHLLSILDYYYPIDDELVPEDDYYVQEHKNDKIYLVEVEVKKSQYRNAKYYSVQNGYYLNDFLDNAVQQKKEQPPTGKTIFELWKNVNPKTAIFKRINEEKYIKITYDPSKQMHYSGSCRGYYSYNGPPRYNWRECDKIYGTNDPIWELAWYY